MPTTTVELLVEGGKASAGPPIGTTLGPLKLNIGQIVSDINKKTADFKGMQVPVKIHVNPDDKSYKIELGTPPASALIKKEANVEKGSGNPLADKIADLKIQQVIKVAKMKEGDLLGKNMFSRVKEILGTCNSMGILVEGKPAKDLIVDINTGAFKKEIEEGRTELSAEELKKLEVERKKLQEEIEKKKEHFTSLAKKAIEELAGKPRSQIKAKMIELGVPTAIIEELLPVEAAGGAAGAAAAAAKPEAAGPKK
ncbi:50S ribosomal protein L11 [archaeon]|nr:50S ribosomal protein L11 [archaeon]